MIAMVARTAPVGNNVVEYDQQHLALYAAILDADAAGLDWRDAAPRLMGIDVMDAGARACWASHLERARWIVGDGLGNAILAFGQQE
ncbi:hypothetical protein [Sphingobium sp. Cam5-1]|uniref:hypothetical protein n=1 Tax=Sphingobium sp. Cam5-1 TaxID=2789327 RepID=UPI0018AD2689|nr:hypothetical protein [Sphingobium sp. Cam5-1]QPI71955.1 hypothetical protein IZV00_08455 [Sphingobium sp. Cam5-1]